MRALTNTHHATLAATLDAMDDENALTTLGAATDDHGVAYAEPWDERATHRSFVGHLWMQAFLRKGPLERAQELAASAIKPLLMVTDEIVLAAWPDVADARLGQPTLLACEQYGIPAVRDAVRSRLADIPISDAAV